MQTKTVMFHKSKSKYYFTSCTCTEVGFECVECVLLLWIDSLRAMKSLGCFKQLGWLSGHVGVRSSMRKGFPHESWGDFLFSLYVPGSINSHYFHIIRDGHQPKSVGVYVPVIRIPIKGGMTIPNIATFDHMAHMMWFPLIREVERDVEVKDEIFWLHIYISGWSTYPPPNIPP